MHAGPLLFFPCVMTEVRVTLEAKNEEYRNERSNQDKGRGQDEVDI